MQRILTFRIDPDTLAWLRREAAARGLSQSQYLRLRLHDAQAADRIEALLTSLQAETQAPQLALLTELVAEALLILQRLAAASQPQLLQQLRNRTQQLLRERQAEPRA